MIYHDVIVNCIKIIYFMMFVNTSMIVTFLYYVFSYYALFLAMTLLYCHVHVRLICAIKVIKSLWVEDFFVRTSS